MKGKKSLAKEVDENKKNIGAIINYGRYEIGEKNKKGNEKILV